MHVKPRMHYVYRRIDRQGYFDRERYIRARRAHDLSAILVITSACKSRLGKPRSQVGPNLIRTGTTGNANDLISASDSISEM